MEIDYKFLFTIVLVLTIIQRIVELFISKSHEKSLLKKGAIIIKERVFLPMVIMHTSWLAVILIYLIRDNTQFSPLIFWPGLIVFLLGQLLRVTSILTLGERWTAIIVVLPNEDVIKKGIFNYIKHPNYWGVILEIAALPMIAGMWSVSLIFSLINLVVLYYRIDMEEKMLDKYNHYHHAFSQTRES